MLCGSIAAFNPCNPIRRGGAPFYHQLRKLIPARDCLTRIARAWAFVFCFMGTAMPASAQTGMASVYAHSATRTASGGRASPSSLTAAHRSLPFGTIVRVTNYGNGRSVVVRITDRGPFVRGRMIDVTPAAARMLGFSGLARVTLQVLGRTGG
jgi:rare lipoprotein A